MKKSSADLQTQAPATLQDLLEESGLKLYRLLELLDMSKKAWYTRMERPGQFSISEIFKITAILNKVRFDESKPEITPTSLFEAIAAHYQSTTNNVKELN